MTRVSIPFSEVPQGYITVKEACAQYGLGQSGIKSLCERNIIKSVLARAPNRNAPQRFINPSDLDTYTSKPRRRGGATREVIRRPNDPEYEYNIFEVATWHGDPIEVHEWFEQMEKENRLAALRWHCSACVPYVVDTGNGYVGERVTYECLDAGVWWRT